MQCIHKRLCQQQHYRVRQNVILVPHRCVSKFQKFGLDKNKGTSRILKHVKNVQFNISFSFSSYICSHCIPFEIIKYHGNTTEWISSNGGEIAGAQEIKIDWRSLSSILLNFFKVTSHTLLRCFVKKFNFWVGLKNVKTSLNENDNKILRVKKQVWYKFLWLI